MFIKNFDTLASTPKRKVALSLVEAAFESIQPKHALESGFVLQDPQLSVHDKNYDLSQYNRVFLIGFGKGSSGICKIIEGKLGNRLTAGFDIDVVDEAFTSVYYTKGTHPLPSQTNLNYTNQVLEKIKNLTEKDLVLVVICGGGSAMFEVPNSISLETLIEVNKALLRSGATISEMNVIRKHLSKVKGGGLAKHLYPATIVSLVFSDVPGNDLSVIASGTTVKDPSTLTDVKAIIEKYQLTAQVSLRDEDFSETPKEDMYFVNVANQILLSNLTALQAMEKKAQEQGFKTTILSDRLEGDAEQLGKMLIEQAKPGEILLAAGESTLKVTGTGKGGRNQALVLAALPYLTDDTIIVSFDSDGQDFYYFTGAIGDMQTVVKAQALQIDANALLEDDNAYEFWQKTGDGIFTDKLESNVSDIMMVCKI